MADPKNNNDAKQDGGIIVPMQMAVPLIVAAVIIAVAIIYFLTFTTGGGVNNPSYYRTNAAEAADITDGIFLDGIWDITERNYNDEFITIEFNDNRFTMVTDIYIANADIENVLDTLDEVKEFNLSNKGGETEIISNGGSVILRVTVNGTFIFNDNELMLVSDNNIQSIYPFSWDGAVIRIDRDVFTQRQDVATPEQEAYDGLYPEPLYETITA